MCIINPNYFYYRKKEMRDKMKAKRDKRRAKQELSMKHDIKDVERQGKQESLHRVLTAHLQLLCSLNMIQEVRILNSSPFQNFSLLGKYESFLFHFFRAFYQESKIIL